MLMKYAVDQYGNLVHIDYVENGLACKAVCPDCGEPVVAKQGRSMDWFFSHRSGAPDCVSANESTLHRVAKWILRQEMRLLAPSDIPDGLTNSDAALVVLSSLKVERAVGLLTPDVLATNQAGEIFAVEFAVTSFCNQDKVRRLHAIGLPVLEVDLSSFDHDEFDLAKVKDAVCFHPANRKWLLPASTAAVLPSESSSADAESPPCPEPQPSDHVETPPTQENPILVEHEVILIRRVPVHIRRLPWGNYSVWHRPNGPVRAIVEPACRFAPGTSWNKKYRNWLVPAESILGVRRAILHFNRTSM